VEDPRVVRAAVEEGDLLRLGGVGEVEHRRAALVPGLHHHVTARDRDEVAVVRDADLVVLLDVRDLVVAAEDHLLALGRVDDVEDGVGAQLVGVGRVTPATV
jgi:hypothetical protein